jgi:hypothetical protein
VTITLRGMKALLSFDIHKALMIRNSGKKAIQMLGNLYVNALLKREYQSQQEDPRGPNERLLEYSFALNALSLSRYTDILDVGCGLRLARYINGLRLPCYGCRQDLRLLDG